MSNQANESAPVVEENIPYLRVTDARAAAAWYRRLGYQTEWEHKFGPDFPMTISVARNGRAGTRLFLSEHTGDATPDTLIYVRVADVDTIAAEFEAEIKDSGWTREVWLSDPDATACASGLQPRRVRRRRSSRTTTRRVTPKRPTRDR